MLWEHLVMADLTQKVEKALHLLNQLSTFRYFSLLVFIIIALLIWQPDSLKAILSLVPKD